MMLYFRPSHHRLDQHLFSDKRFENGRGKFEKRFEVAPTNLKISRKGTKPSRSPQPEPLRMLVKRQLWTLTLFRPRLFIQIRFRGMLFQHCQHHRSSDFDIFCFHSDLDDLIQEVHLLTYFATPRFHALVQRGDSIVVADIDIGPSIQEGFNDLGPS